MPVFAKDFVPKPIQMQNHPKTILSFGAEMSNTFCLYKKGIAYPSKVFGDTAQLEVFEEFKKEIEKVVSQEKVELLLADLHPGYNTALYAQEVSAKHNLPLVRVQHHLAHIYSAALEHHLADFVGIACDGMGYGSDETIWGGEVFLNGQRMGHLESHLQLGGDAATEDPFRMLFSILSTFLTNEEIKRYVPLEAKDLEVLKKQLEARFNTPITTSCGRVLDAASVLLGFSEKRTFDGSPAILLEQNSTEPYEIPPVIKDNVLLTTPLFQFLIQNMDKDKKRLAASVQLYLAKGLFEIASSFKKPIVFSGGCAYNKIMSSFLEGKGVQLNQEIPCGDAGVSIGQIAYYLSTNPRN